MKSAALLSALLAVAAGAQAAPRQNVGEYLSAQLDTDAGFSVPEKAQLLDALRQRFAAYANDVVHPDRPQAAQVVMRMIIEGRFDDVSYDRISDVAFAAYQAISRGAPADVVEGIALYGYRKKISADHISAWSNGYAQMTANRVPGEIAAGLVHDAMEQDWDDATFDTLKWSLVQAAKEGFNLNDYAVYLLGHMADGGRRPGELTGAAQAYFKKLARSKAKPELPAYEGVFSRKPFPDPVYEAKPRPKLEVKPEAQEFVPEVPEPKHEARPKKAAPPSIPQELGLSMGKLWPNLEGSAKSYLGTPYVWGGTSHRGIDCSALTQNSYGENRVGIPRVSRDQWKTGTVVDYKKLREGDLIFFNTMGVGVSHVGMVVSADGPRFIHASSSHGVMLQDLSKKYYQTRYLGARRIVP